jgi:hypothetical protein
MDGARNRWPDWKVLGLVALFSTGCMDSMESVGADDDRTFEGYGDADGDGDGDGDADGDWYGYDTASTDSSEGDADDLPAEREKRVDYKVPQGAGKYVFIPEESQDQVAIVDSETLSVQTVEVGSRPTHLVSLNEPGLTSVAVINLNSDDVTIIRMDDAGQVTTVTIPVRPDTNALAPSPDGRFLIAYHEPLFTAETGAPHTDQEISVLTVIPGAEGSVARTVGMHPWKVAYNQDVTRAYVVTEGGVNVIDLTALDTNPRTEPIHLFEPGSYDSETADIEITPDGRMAIGRNSGMEELVVVPLDGSEGSRTLFLPGEPTDLDLSADGRFGVVVLRSLDAVGLFDLPLAEETDESPFRYVDLDNRLVGVATLSGDGTQILLHTTVAEEDEDQRRLTLMSDDGSGGWRVSSAVLERPIDTVAAVNDESGRAATAVVMHQEVSGTDEQKPYGYSLVTIPSLMPKLQQLSDRPGQLLLTPDGLYGFLLQEEEDGTGTYTAEKLDLGTLIVNDVTFSSPTLAAGYAAETNKVFVSQSHPSGRMSFVGVADDSFATVTGYKLNEDIVVSP